MIDKINAQAKTEAGKTVYPHMFGDHGWYDFTPEKYKQGAEEIWYWSMQADDLKRLPPSGWNAYLQGKNPDYPEQTLRNDLEIIRRKMAAMRKDTTTPDTRLADDSLAYNPAAAANLVRLMLGGLHHGNRTLVVHSRVRYFDPEKHRSGLPADVAALVEQMTADTTVLTLVNVNQVHSRTVTIQAGGYGEHHFTSVEAEGKKETIDGGYLTVRLEAGAGTRLVLGTRRYAHQPTFARSWE